MNELVHSASDVRVSMAARGVRPALGDDDALPSAVFKFAPECASYKVQSDGSGTFVYLYGTDEYGHSCAVRAEHFRPYLYVSLASIDAHSDDESVRRGIIENLIGELQARLVAISAASRQSWAPERVAFRRSLAGRVRIEWRRSRARLEPADDAQRVLPIVGWRVAHGVPVKGSGAGAGYRGMRQRRFLQIFFYSPTLVSKCRALLHGRHAELGAVEQCARLGRGGRGDQTGEMRTTEGADGGGDVAADKQWQSKVREVGGQQTMRRFQKAPLEPETDEREALEAELAEMEAEDVGEVAPDDVHYAAEAGGACDARDDASEDSEERTEERAEDEEWDTTKWYVLESESREDDAVRALEWRAERRFARRAARRLRDVCAQSNMLDRQRFAVYEADIDFVLRFALDCGFSYEHWLEIDTRAAFATLPDGSPAPAPVRVRRARDRERETRAQIELRVDYRALRYRADDPIQNTIPRHVVLSLDCEMETGPQGAFPAPETESMLQCVCIVRDDRELEGRGAPHGKNGFWYRSVTFALGGTLATQSAPRTNCWERHVLCFDNEAVLFEALGRFVRELGPSIVTGYNTDGFDLPYMLERATVLGVGREFASAWGRSRYSSRLRIVERTFQSSAFGSIVFQDVRAEGLVFIDLFLKLKKDPMVKLRSLALNFVASHYLGEQKEDVAYSMINTLQKTPAGREKLRLYCEKDALLPLQIMAKLLTLPSMIEMARINGCTMEQLLKRGQQVHHPLLAPSSLRPRPPRSARALLAPLAQKKEN